MTSTEQLSKEKSKHLNVCGFKCSRWPRYEDLFSPVQSTADQCPADLTQVSCCQANKTAFLVTNNDAIPAGQTTAGHTLLWHDTNSLEAMEENSSRLGSHCATELQIPHTAPILLTTNTCQSLLNSRYLDIVTKGNPISGAGLIHMCFCLIVDLLFHNRS